MMTDIHTHILPQMDDGAETVQESLQLLQMQTQQGVDAVFLTPHFFGNKEPIQSFLKRRQTSWNLLEENLPVDYPRLVLGAEVAWFSGIERLEYLEDLCLGTSKCLLLELPYRTWNANLPEEVFRFACTSGVIPVLAHLERYIPCQKPELIRDFLQMGLPMQVGADSLCKLFQRRRVRKLLQQGQWILASDCHGTRHRAPCMKQAADYLYQHMDRQQVDRMVTWLPENQE